MERDPLPMDRRKRRKLELHDRMLEVAMDLFERQGIEKTSAVQICREADVARKTFFNHFSSKQDLVAEIADQQLSEVLANLEAASKLQATTPKRLRAYFRRLARYGEQARPMTKELMHEVFRVNQLKAAEGGPKIRRAFRGLILSCIDCGDVTTRQDVETLTDMAMGSFNVLMTSWAYTENYPLAKRCRAAADCLAELLCGPVPDPPR